MVEPCQETEWTQFSNSQYCDKHGERFGFNERCPFAVVLMKKGAEKRKVKVIDPPKKLIDKAVKNNPENEDLRRKAEVWIAENPRVMDLYRQFAKELLAMKRKFNVSLLTERVRWECMLSFDEDFKISNNHRAYIARKLTEEMPELKAIFKFRETRW